MPIKRYDLNGEEKIKEKLKNYFRKFIINVIGTDEAVGKTKSGLEKELGTELKENQKNLQKVQDPILKNEVCSKLFSNSKFLGSSKRLHSSPFLKMESSSFDDKDAEIVKRFVVEDDSPYGSSFLASYKH
jgi:hypothetical protein